jgi:hypothetical protein
MPNDEGMTNLKSVTGHFVIRISSQDVAAQCAWRQHGGGARVATAAMFATSPCFLVSFCKDSPGWQPVGRVRLAASPPVCAGLQQMCALEVHSSAHTESFTFLNRLLFQDSFFTGKQMRNES